MVTSGLGREGSPLKSTFLSELEFAYSQKREFKGKVLESENESLMK